jgi:hypothetical protein
MRTVEGFADREGRFDWQTHPSLGVSLDLIIEKKTREKKRGNENQLGKCLHNRVTTPITNANEVSLANRKNVKVNFFFSFTLGLRKRLCLYFFPNNNNRIAQPFFLSERKKKKKKETKTIKRKKILIS